MDRAQKAAIVDELRETLAKVQSLVITDFRGLVVAKDDQLRREVRKNACIYRVVKNTLVKRAITGTPMEVISPLLEGPTAIAYSFEDPVTPAKVLDRCQTELERLVIKGGFLAGQMLDAEGVKRLAKMKGKDELRSQFLATLLAPAQTMVRLLAAGPQQFVYLLQARKSKLEGQGASVED